MDLLTVERYEFKPDWTVGRLLINGQKNGFVIEDQVRPSGAPKVHGQTAIPFGRYRLGLRQSPKLSSQYLWSDTLKKLIIPKQKSEFPTIRDFRPHDMIWLREVPNFEFILIHWGNTADDTEGCLLVGDALGIVKGNEAVLHSRTYYKSIYPQLYPLIKQGEHFINLVKV
ncbi:MAG: DUF5675 family protein [Spirosomataceae bacterium]